MHTQARWLIAALLLFQFSVQTAHAGPIINNVEWYQPAELVGYSWFDYTEICNEDAGNGLCTGTLSGGQDLTGWTWASVSDVRDLFNGFIGFPAIGSEPGIYFEFNTTWAIEFLNVFEPTDTSSFSETVSGFTRETKFGRTSSTAYLGQVGNRRSSSYDDFANTGNSISKDWNNPEVGGWFFRSASVPAPHPVVLIVLGLVALQWQQNVTRTQVTKH